MEEKILRCVKILNKIFPAWRNRVDHRKLDLQNPQACVLGQIFGNYDLGLERFKREGYDDLAPWLYGVSIKFDECTEKNWNRLNDEWNKILKRIPITERKEPRNKRASRWTRNTMSILENRNERNGCK